jgi:hypothetical protein
VDVAVSGQLLQSSKLSCRKSTEIVVPNPLNRNLPAGQFLQLDAAVTSEYLPSSHIIQSVLPKEFVYLPLGQFLQSDTSSEPVAVVNVPIGQYLQYTADGKAVAALYLPEGQSLQSDTSSEPEISINVPFGQSLHSELA